MDYSSLPRRKIKSKMVKRGSVGADLHQLDLDKTVTTDPRENSRRRALRLQRQLDKSWGFTLQTYGIKHKRTNEIEIMTYVDYIEIGGPAWMAGMRKGDVILSVNGEKVGDATHRQLVDKIRKATDELRMVVLFEDCCKKVELHDRFIKLKSVLRSKYQELRDLEQKERQLLEDYCEAKGLNRFEQIRQSIMSSVSSNSDSWDAYSMIASPYNQHSTGHFHNQSQWSSVSSLKSFNMEDNYSMTEDNVDYIDSELDGGIAMKFGKASGSDSDIRRPKYPNAVKLRDSIVSMSSDSALYKLSSDGAVGQQGPYRRSNSNVEKRNSMDDVFLDNNPDLNVQYFDKDDGQITGTHYPDNIYYPGEHGNIIVPKICIEGKEMYASFDNLDPIDIDKEELLPKIDPATYQNNICAIEIAKEMVENEKISNAKEKEKLGVVEGNENASNDGAAESSKFNVSKLRRSPRLVKKMSPVFENHVVDQSCEDQDIVKNALENGAINKTAGLRHESSVKNNGAKGHSPRSKKRRAPHICGKLSYQQLKSSVPDTMVSFHTEECQVIYINETNETTKL